MRWRHYLYVTVIAAGVLYIGSCLAGIYLPNKLPDAAFIQREELSRNVQPSGRTHHREEYSREVQQERTEEPGILDWLLKEPFPCERQSRKHYKHSL